MRMFWRIVLSWLCRLMDIRAVTLRHNHAHGLALNRRLSQVLELTNATSLTEHLGLLFLRYAEQLGELVVRNL